MASLFAIALLTACPPPVGKEDPEAEVRQELIDELDANLRDRSLWLLPSPPEDGDWSAFPQAASNPLTDAKVALGRALFYDPGLAGDPESLAFRQISCGTCHDPDAGFGSGQVPGRGLGWGGEGRGQGRRLVAELDLNDADFSLLNDLRVVNQAWTAEVAGWIGGFDPAHGIYPPQLELYDGVEGLELFIESALLVHGFFPTTNALVPPGSVLEEEVYAELVAAAFPEIEPGERMTRRQVALALAAYVRSIVTDEAPFQEFLRLDPGAHPDEVPLSDAALRGAILVFGDARCVACHAGPTLASDTARNVGMRTFDYDTEIPGYLLEDPQGESGWGTVAQYYSFEAENLGRYRLTDDPADLGAYVAPTLYGAGAPNVANYGHGAALHSLEEVIRHFTLGPDPDQNPSLDPAIASNLDPVLFGDAPLTLSSEEIADIVTFIEEGLTDPTLADEHRPAPLSLGGYCARTNDPLSQLETPGCEYARDP